jgi:uncharacterized protein Yka (UPF0111/DUF47 family)
MNLQKIVANLNKEFVKDATRFVKHRFYGMRRVPINRLRRYNNLLEIIETDCDINLNQSFKKLYSKYDY